MPFGLIASLQVALDLNEQLATVPGAELGGALIGHKKTPSILEIERFTWLPPKGQHAGQFRLNESEFERLSAESHAVVGYFRTVADDNFRLRKEETEFIGDRGRDVVSVVLLIQTSTTPYTAGFFFKMKDGGFAPMSFLDFPLNAEILRNQTEPGSKELNAEISALKQTEVLSAPAIDIQNPTDNFSAALDEEFASSGTTSGRQVRLPLEPSPGSEPTSKLAIRPIRSNDPSEIPSQFRITKNGSAHTSRRTLLIPVLLIALLPLATLCAFLLRAHGQSTSSASVTTEYPLQLEVESRSKGLDVRWNPLSNPITQAREGRISFLEGNGNPRTMALNREELTTGHAYYRSLAKRLEVQMEVTDASGKVSREAVVAFSSPQ